MTNLKNKLSASVRQAKASAQPADQPATRTTQRADRTAPVAAAAKTQRPQPLPKQALSTPVKPPQESAGFGFPSRIWPD
jgi:hypothetical protein